jgi:hypothetical protein
MTADPKTPPETPAPPAEADYTWNEEKQIWVFHNPAGSMGYNYLYRDFDSEE